MILKPIPRRSEADLRALIADTATPAAERKLAAHTLVDRGVLERDIMYAMLEDECEHGRSMVSSCIACDRIERAYKKSLKLQQLVVKAIKSELESERVKDAPHEANYHNLMDTFEGYRTYCAFGPNAVCPYRPGPRHYSWTLGFETAKKDTTRVEQ